MPSLKSYIKTIIIHLGVPGAILWTVQASAGTVVQEDELLSKASAVLQQRDQTAEADQQLLNIAQGLQKIGTRDALITLSKIAERETTVTELVPGCRHFHEVPVYPYQLEAKSAIWSIRHRSWISDLEMTPGNLERSKKLKRVSIEDIGSPELAASLEFLKDIDEADANELLGLLDIEEKQQISLADDYLYLALLERSGADPTTLECKNYSIAALTWFYTKWPFKDEQRLQDFLNAGRKDPRLSSLVNLYHVSLAPSESTAKILEEKQADGALLLAQDKSGEMTDQLLQIIKDSSYEEKIRIRAVLAMMLQDTVSGKKALRQMAMSSGTLPASIQEEVHSWCSN